MVSVALGLGAALAATMTLGCESSFDPAAHVVGLRVLAVVADPPEVPLDASTTVRFRTLVVDTAMRPSTLEWAACVKPSVVGQTPTARECLEQETASFLLPLAETAMADPADALFETMIPSVNGMQVGRPDSTGGVYLPIRLTATVSGDRVRSIYGLRLSQPGQTSPPNRNPRLQDVRFSLGPAFAPDQPFDPANPPVLMLGHAMRLHPVVDAADAESYDIVELGQVRRATEELRITWFAAAGTFTEVATKPERPDTEWRAEKYLPQIRGTGPENGATIYIWVVLRDERGGADYLERKILLVR